jgi:predicted TIM-barrel fold metal-dependent hydrolase
MVPALEAVGAEEILMFASDYPHWDADDPLHVTRRLPQGWRDKVMYDNARAFYRWSDGPNGAARSATVAAGARANGPGK